MRNVTISGIRYPVIEDLGFVQSAGYRAIIVAVHGVERVAIKCPGGWKLRPFAEKFGIKETD